VKSGSGTNTRPAIRRYLFWFGLSIWIVFGIWISREWITPREKVPVIVYLVDTLRADRMSIYGYDRRTSPNIEALARESVVFENAYAAAPWTLPSIASLFTSKFSCEHGVISYLTGLNPNLATFATILRDEGYITASMYGNAWAGPDWGLDNGFQMKVAHQPYDNDRIPDAIAAIDVAGEQPFFLYVHTMETHDTDWIAESGPINIQKYLGEFGHVSVEQRAQWKATRELFTNYNWSDWDKNQEEQIKLMNLLEANTNTFDVLYDTSVLIADDNFGRFVEMLKEKGIWDRAITIFLSDHGEEIGDHDNWFHGQTVYEELSRVPLMIHFPDDEHGGERFSGPVSIIDVLPTVLDYHGIEKSCAGCRGSSLWGLLENRKSDPDRIVQIYRNDLNERFHPHAVIRGNKNVGLRKQNWKGILNLDQIEQTWSMELYDLMVDPGEKSNIASTETEVAAYFRKYALNQLNSCQSSIEHKPTPAEPDETTRERLKALGYAN
jgi:arylsulfatase A-like enzyme